jgi:predicted enzyme related to lactoylglutathione lyase
MKLHSAVFYTKDINAIAEFYEIKLGFKAEYRDGDKFISFLIGDNGRLAIKKQVEQREVPGHQTVFIEVDDAEELYQRAKANGLDILKSLTVEKWATEFTILDPDGNKVLFRS